MLIYSLYTVHIYIYLKKYKWNIPDTKKIKVFPLVYAPIICPNWLIIMQNISIRVDLLKILFNVFRILL